MRTVAIFFGMPGSGKGTQSARVGERYGITAITTGEILRGKALEDKALKKFLASGSLLADEIIEEFLEEKIESLGESNFVFDGFPRTLSQLKTYKSLEEEYSLKTLPVYIEVSSEEVLKRLTTRYVCERCGFISFKDGQCKCGGILVKRSDDHPEVIKRRLQVFDAETMPVIEHYQKEGCLITINGEGTFDEVSARIYEKLDNYFKK